MAAEFTEIDYFWVLGAGRNGEWGLKGKDGTGPETGGGW